MPKNRMRPIHPGEILREEYLQPLNLTPNALAIALRVPAPRINDIVLERRAITPNTALQLALVGDSGRVAILGKKLAVTAPTIASRVFRLFSNLL